MEKFKCLKSAVSNFYIVKKKINLLEAGESVSRNRTRKLGLITMYIHFDSFKKLDLPN